MWLPVKTLVGRLLTAATKIAEEVIRARTRKRDPV